VGFSVIGGTQLAVLAVYELSNMQGTPYDTSALQVDNTSPTPGAGPITTTAPRDILFASLSISGPVSTIAFACGTIDVSTVSGYAIAHFTETATGSYSDCWVLTGIGSTHQQTFLSAYKGN